LKTLLKNAKSTSGSDLYQHMTEVFNKLILHYPSDALDKFEEVSYLVKHKNLNLNEFLKIDDTRNYSELAASLKDWIEKAPQLVFDVSVLLFQG
jgi:hypothetical protein